MIDAASEKIYTSRVTKIYTSLGLGPGITHTSLLDILAYTLSIDIIVTQQSRIKLSLRLHSCIGTSVPLLFIKTMMQVPSL